jgi:hypothetical protein
MLPHVYKRFNNEIEQLYKYYKTNKTPNFEINVKYKEKVIELYLHDNIKFVLGQLYPFHAPEVFINEMPYSSYFKSPSPRMTLYLKQHNIKCLCCSTILCDNNWSPIFTIIKVLDEMENTKKLIKIIKYEILLDEIIEKNKLPEIMSKEILLYL